MTQTNFLAVLVAAIAATVVGFLWYGPLFGKQWSELMGFTPEKMAEMKKKGMTGTYVTTFIAALIMAYVLSNSIAARPLLTTLGSLWLTFWIWLGFVATVLIGMVLWEGKPVKLYLIISLYYLVSLFVMGLILVSWR